MQSFIKIVKKALPITMALSISLFFYYSIQNIGNLVDVFNFAIETIKPFIIGFVISFLLTGPLNFIEDNLFDKTSLNKRTKRGMSILLVYILVVITLILAIMIVLPQLILSIKNIAITAPESINMFFNKIEDVLFGYPELYYWVNDLDISYDTIITWVKNFISSMVPFILIFTGSITKSFYSFFMGIIISCYMLGSKEKFVSQFTKLTYATFSDKVAVKLIDLGRYCFSIFNRFLIGKSIDSFIIGCLCFVLMSIFKMPYPVLISFIVGATNIVPFFGPFIGAVPGFLIILTVNPITALWFTLLILGLQQFDGNILGPKILGDSTGLSGFWVLFSTLVFGKIFGFLGMLLGVPTFAVIYKLFKEFVYVKLSRKNNDIDKVDIDKVDIDK
ncbi:MAG: AI-2E family transporter [Oscillospiraceae bacterium]